MGNLTIFASVKKSFKFKDAQCAQLVWYFKLYGKSGRVLWFGIPLFDNREVNKPVQKEVVLWDIGTATTIYSISKRDYFKTQPQVGERYKLTIPLMESIKKCWKFAKAKGNFEKSDTLETAYLAAMNIGFEMPGTIDIKATLNHLGVYVETL